MNNTYKEKVLKFVLNKGGEVTFPEFQGLYVKPFTKIKGVVFTEEYDESLDEFDDENDPENWNWNKFCERIHDTINAGYCSWIGWPKKMKGIVAAYNSKGQEVKLKYFEDYKINWKRLLIHLKENNEA